jgi:hypothetical protein
VVKAGRYGTRSKETLGSGRCGTRSTLRGELSSARSSLSAHPLVSISVWASKNYVDRKRVGIWGWVSHDFLMHVILMLQ